MPSWPPTEPVKIEDIVPTLATGTERTLTVPTGPPATSQPIVTQTLSEAISCLQCKKSFPSDPALERHRAEFHPPDQTSPSTYDCVTPDGLLSKPSNFDSLPESGLSAKISNFDSIPQTGMASKNAPDSNKFECRQCGKMLSTKRTLAHHVKAHQTKNLSKTQTINKRKKCQYCDKDFSTKGLYIHAMANCRYVFNIQYIE